MLPSTTDDLIFSCLSPADLASYARTSKTSREAVNAYMRRAFRLEHVLDRFFTPTETLYFRYLQWRTQMFISGSTALQLLDRSCYPESDLDLYVEHRFRKSVAAWLLSIGYVFQARIQCENPADNATLEDELEVAWSANHNGISANNPFFKSESCGYFGRGVANVYNFYKFSPERKIQLITSNHSPLEIVLNFHSTCVMNIITHDKAYSLYPKATFEERRSLMISTEGSKQDKARAKYEARGWPMIKQLAGEEFNNPRSSFSAGNRYVGDSKCWTIPLYPACDFGEGCMEINSWALKFDNNGIPVMPFNIMLTEYLDFRYLVVDDDLIRYIWPAIMPTAVKKSDLDADLLKLLRYRRIHTFPTR